jgi:ribosomal protein S6
MVDQMPVETTDEVLENEGALVYEIGFHLVPTIPEDDLAAKFGDIRAQIEEAGGSIIGEGLPALTPLAYTISAKGGKFDRAYFGWIKFDLAANKIAALKEICDHTADIIRYLIIKTTIEADPEFKKPLLQLADAETVPATPEEPKAVVSEEELEKSLEGMIVE